MGLDPDLAALGELLDLCGEADDGVRRAGAGGHDQYDGVHVDALEAAGDQQAALDHGVADLVVTRSREAHECGLAERDVQLGALGLRHECLLFVTARKGLSRDDSNNSCNNNIYTLKSKERGLCTLSLYLPLFS